VSAENVDSNTGNWCCVVITLSERGNNYYSMHGSRNKENDEQQQKLEVIFLPTHGNDATLGISLDDLFLRAQVHLR